MSQIPSSENQPHLSQPPSATDTRATQQPVRAPQPPVTEHQQSNARALASTRLKSWNSPAVRIALTYLAMSIAWILGSDQVLAGLFAGKPELMRSIEVYKGLGFISLTALIIYWLVSRALRELERTTEHLQRVQERYDLAMKGANEAIWDWDVVSNTSYWSPKIYELLGFSPSDAEDSQNKWSNRLHPEDRPRALQLLKDHIETGTPYDLEYRLLTKGGTYRWFRSRGRAERDASGNAVRMAGSLSDIHDRVLAAEMRESQNQILEMVARGAPTPSVLEAIVRAVETQHPGVMGSVILLDDDGETMRPAFGPSLPSEFSRAIDGIRIGPNIGSCGTAMATGRRIIVADISTDPLWASFRVLAEKFGLRACWSEPILLPDGRVAGSFAMYSNVPREPTEQELQLTSGAAHLAGIALHKDRAEAALRESRLRMALLVSQSPVGIMILDSQARVVDWNAASERMFGYSASEMVGKEFWPIVPPEARETVKLVWAQLLECAGGSRSSNRNITKDGRLIDCEWYNTPLTDAQGKLVGVASIVQDVSDRLANERHQKFMLAELDHRVKNNLATILSLAEQTGRSSETYPQFQQAFIGRLRALARMHGALASSKWEGAPLNTIVTQTLSTFSASPLGFTATGPAVMLSPREAQAVTLSINELSTNAAKYGALSVDGGSVTVNWVVLPQAVGTPAKLAIHWTERGGPPVKAPTRRGFGTELIEGIVSHELSGRVRFEYPESGVRCVLEFPLDLQAAPEGIAAAATPR